MLLLIPLVLVALTVPSPRYEPSSPRYEPPVPGAVIERFRPPSCAWCPGNRGIDFATTPGEPVRASGPGVVTFAGTVGRDRFVVIAHPDGIRTTYAYLAGVRAVAGQGVATGDVVGWAGARLHLGARRGATYLDPATLFRRQRVVPRLVPTAGTASRWARSAW